MYATPARTVVTTPPTKEPVLRATAKNHLRVPASTTDDDTLIDTVIAASRRYVEHYTGRALMSQTLTAWFDAAPPCGAPFSLGRAPVTAITSLTSYDTANASTVLSSSAYLLDSVSEPCRVVLNDGYDWPSSLRNYNSVAVLYTAGYGNTEDVSVPADIRSALLLLVGWFYENREAAYMEPGLTPAPLVYGVETLLAPYRLSWI